MTITKAASYSPGSAGTITVSDNGTVTIPLAAITDEGLANYKRAIIAEELRRLRARRAAEEAEDRANEQKSGPELASIAQRLSAGIARGCLSDERQH